MCLYAESEEELLDSGVRRARTTHECRECERVIEPGETYHYWTLLDEFENRPRTDKMCAHCWGTLMLGVALTGCELGWYWDEIHSLDVEMGFVGNMIGDEGHSLTAAQRLKLLRTVVGRRHDWRRRDGSLLPVPGEEAA